MSRGPGNAGQPPKARIYLVGNTLLDAPPEAGLARDYLVRAPTMAQAVAYVVRNHITCRVASQDDLVSKLGLGIEIEDATLPNTTADGAAQAA